jgi:tetratricopeptide (TPR) repeat protein
MSQQPPPMAMPPMMMPGMPPMMMMPPHPMHRLMPYGFHPQYHHQHHQPRQQSAHQLTEEQEEEIYHQDATDIIDDDTLQINESMLNQLDSNWSTQELLPEVAPSKEGYMQAWKDLSDQLESGIFTDDNKWYTYQENNPYRQNIASLTASLQTQEEQEIAAQSLYNQGIQYFNEGHILTSILTFEALIQDYPNSSYLSNSWYYLGLCHTEQDDDNKAIQCFQSSLEMDPYHIDSLLSLGTSYVNEVNPQRALECLKAWIEHNPRFASLHHNIEPDIYSDGTEMDKVLQLMLTINELASDDMNVQVVLGVLYNVLHEYNNAVDAFQKAIDLSTDRNYTLLNKVSDNIINTHIYIIVIYCLNNS